jgi:excinuclease ABC subunit C
MDRTRSNPSGHRDGSAESEPKTPGLKTGQIGKGVAIIRDALKNLPSRPGVYRMLNSKGDALYVGKAKNLKKRVTSYTRLERMPMRLQRMVTETTHLEVVTTHTEAEALLLESNLIKKLKPRYNILLRDGKSFAYIMVTGDHPYPRIVKHRGKRKTPHAYYGPFASAGAVNQSLATLQRAFLLRTCSDTVFSNRSRACLLHQIKRCCAPCVDKVSEGDYAGLIRQSQDFLNGDSNEIQEELSRKMDEASATLDFESAATYRDRIRALTNVQSHQDINLPTNEDTDIIGLHRAGGQSCIQIFFFRGGQNFGNRAYYPSHGTDDEDGAIIEAFLAQFYDTTASPPSILLSHRPPNTNLIAEALSIRADRKVELRVPVRGTKRKLVDHVTLNAREAHGRRLAESSAQRKLLASLAEIFDLPASPERVEVFDNSHISGTNMVGGMIVSGPTGFEKNAYRKFNIKSPDLAPGDDYGAMKEVLTRRFARAQKEDPERTKSVWPDLVLIDGGKGQLSTAQQTLEDLGIDDMAMVAISKGPDRNAGREQFHRVGKTAFTLPPAHPALYFLQRLRDEAHRFAISSHRNLRSKAISRSLLDEVAGIGGKRKKALLYRFGSAKAITQAGIEDLLTVDGISAALAKRIYDHFHPDH